MPHKTIDALLIAAEVVTTLQTLVAREVNPQQAAVVSVGTLHAGTTAANIIADSATLSGTVRWFETEVGDQLASRIPEVIQGIATALRGSCRGPVSAQSTPHGQRSRRRGARARGAG